MYFTPNSYPATNRPGRPRVIAVRLLVGSVTPHGRVCGETDREVHFLYTTFAISAGGVVTALCEAKLTYDGLERLDEAEGTGVPCNTCYLAFLMPKAPAEAIPKQGRWREW